MKEITFLDAVMIAGQFGYIGSLTDNIIELADFIESESSRCKHAKPSLSVYWIDTSCSPESKEDVYVIRYNTVFRDGKYYRHSPYLIFNCSYYKEWRKKHGVRSKFH